MRKDSLLVICFDLGVTCKNIPVRNDPKPEECVEIIMAYGTSTTVIFLRPVKYGFAQCHYCGGKSDERCRRRGKYMLGVQVV